jgi:internalin A
MEDYPFIREFRSPLTRGQLRPLDPRCQVVQFSEPLSDSDLKRIAEFLRDYPAVTFRVYGQYSGGCDLEFLRYFDFVRNFQVDVFDLKDFSGINYLPPDLEYLGLGQTRVKHSLKFLERFTSLKELFIESHKKNIEIISQLTMLENLTLRSITLPDLSILKPLKQLLFLFLKLGGIKDLRLLPEIGKLRYLEIWRVRGLTDLDVISSIPTLQYLFLQTLKGVTKLPSLQPLSLLRRVHIETMKGLNDLSSVAEAPGLEELLVVDMPHLKPEALRPFVGHPTLKRATVGLGSIKKNDAVQKLLGLPHVVTGKADFDFI